MQSKHGHVGVGGLTVFEDEAFAPLRLARNSLCIAITYASDGVFACCRGGTPLQQSAQGQVGVGVGVCLFSSSGDGSMFVGTAGIG